jgi:hypothetical protein
VYLIRILKFGGTQKRKDKVRSLLTKIVKALTAKLEIGDPMAFLYLLGNPDHYTNKKFVVFYWKGFVTEALKAWKEGGDVQSDKVILLRNVDGEYIGLSTVDYMYRLYELSEKFLYEWIQIFLRSKCTKAEQKKYQSQKHDDVKPTDDLECDQEKEKEEVQGKYASL